MGLGAAGTAAAIGAAGAIGSAGIQAAGASSAAGKAAGAASQSAYLQAAQMNQNIAQQTPFINAGQYGATTLQNQLASGQLGTPMDLSGMPKFSWDPTQAGLAQTPGYQFQLQQGLQAQQNSATARGLGVSGAQLRGAADYAEGLAGTTYNQQLQNALGVYNAQMGGFQNQFQDYWANQTNRVGQLQNLGTMGENAATGAGYSGVLGAANVGNALNTAGQAQALGQTGTANALGGALSSPQVQTALTQGYNYLSGGGSTISPQTVVNNANYENQQFAQQPAGTYGPFA